MLQPVHTVETALRGLIIATLGTGALAVASLTALSNMWPHVSAEERLMLHDMMSILFSGFMANVTILITATLFFAEAEKMKEALSVTGAVIFLYSIYQAAHLFDQFTLLGAGQKTVMSWQEGTSLLPIFVLQIGVLLVIIARGLWAKLKRTNEPDTAKSSE